MKTTETNKLVHGKGMNDIDEPVTINGKNLKFYNAWVNMLKRCYSGKCQEVRHTYVGCSVCDEWLSLSAFKVWFDANYREGTALDKDILIPGNKVYSPEACRFVPQYINSLLTNAGAIRGELPLGVTAVKTRLKTGEISITYRGQCCDGRGERPNKTFSTVPEAAAWYVMKKKEIVREIVLESFWRNEIMSDVATALLEREW